MRTAAGSAPRSRHPNPRAARARTRRTSICRTEHQCCREPSILALDDRNIKTIGVGAAWRHQEPLLRHQHRAAKHEGALAERACGIGWWHRYELRMAAKKAAHLIAVLFREYRARDVDDAS